jgi:hypothetical protein
VGANVPAGVEPDFSQGWVNGDISRGSSTEASTANGGRDTLVSITLTEVEQEMAVRALGERYTVTSVGSVR